MVCVACDSLRDVYWVWCDVCCVMCVVWLLVLVVCRMPGVGWCVSGDVCCVMWGGCCVMCTRVVCWLVCVV